MRLSSLCVFFLLVVSNHGIKLCGWRLAETLQMVCKDYGGFHSTHIRLVRDTSTSQFYEILQYSSSIASESYRPRAVKRGIVDECCRRHCSFHDILAYCAHPNQQAVSEEQVNTTATLQLTLQDDVQNVTEPNSI